MSSINELYQNIRMVKVKIQLFKNRKYPLYQNCKLSEKYSHLEIESLNIDSLKKELKTLKEELLKKGKTPETSTKTDDFINQSISSISLLTDCKFCDNTVDMEKRNCNVCGAPSMDLRRKSSGTIFKSTVYDLNRKASTNIIKESPDFDSVNMNKSQALKTNTIPSECNFCNFAVVNGYCDGCNTHYNSNAKQSEESPDFNLDPLNTTLSGKIPSECIYCNNPVVNDICSVCDTDYNKISDHSITNNFNTGDDFGTRTLPCVENEENDKTNENCSANSDVKNNNDSGDPSVVEADLRTLSNIEGDGDKTNENGSVNLELQNNDNSIDQVTLESGLRNNYNIDEDKDKTNEKGSANSDVQNNDDSVDPSVVEADLRTLSNIDGDEDKTNENEAVDKWICERCDFENEGFEICKMCGIGRNENEIKEIRENNINNEHGRDEVGNREVEESNVVDNGGIGFVLNGNNGEDRDRNMDTGECRECKFKTAEGYECEVCTNVDEMRRNKLESVFIWKCTGCNQDIKEDICPFCGREGPKLSNWICETCGLYNDLLAKECGACGRKNSNIKLCSVCEKDYININSEFCNKCFDKRNPEGIRMSIKNRFTCDKCDKMYVFGANNSCNPCLEKIRDLNSSGNSISRDGNRLK